MAVGEYDGATHDPFADLQPQNRHVLASQWCVGATLRLAREAGGESLEDVAAAIRIPANYLFAVEEENYYGLPGWAHAVGYVRSYALYLGLDPVPLVRRVRDQLALREHVFAQRAAVNSLRISSILTSGGVVLAAVAVAVGLYFTAPALSVTALLAPVPERIVSFLDRSSTAPASAPARIALKSDAVPQAAPTAPTAPAPPTVASASPQPQPIRTMVLTPRVPAAEPGVLVLKPLPRHSLDRGANVLGQVTLRARDVAWFRVEDRRRRVVLERQMAQGEVQRLPDGRDLVIRTSNGEALEYFVDGVFVGDLGAAAGSPAPLSLANLAMRRAGG